MIKKEIYCDLCGRLIEHRNNEVSIKGLLGSKGLYLFADDICQLCVNKIDAVVKEIRC